MKNIPQDRSSEDRVMSHLKAEYGFSAMRPDELVGSQELFDCLQMLREAQQNIAVAEYRQTKKYPKIRDATERFKQKIMKVIKPVSYNYGDQAISHTAQKEQYFQQFLEDYNNINNHDQILEKFRLEYPNTQVDESLSHQVQIAWYYAMKAHGDDMLQMHISLK